MEHESVDVYGAPYILVVRAIYAGGAPSILAVLHLYWWHAIYTGGARRGHQLFSLNRRGTSILKRLPRCSRLKKV